MKSLTLITTFFIIATFSHATLLLVTRPQSQMNQYSMINHSQQQINETELVSGSRCSSPEHKDPIDIITGDANGNQNEMTGRNDQAIAIEMDSRKCWQCGEKGHEAFECKSSDVVCFNCGEFGHIQSECEKPKKVKPKKAW